MAFINVGLESHNVVKKMSFSEMDTSVKDAVDQCMQSYQSCQQAILHCLQKGGVYSDPDHIKLMQDCSAISALTGKFILRESRFTKTICTICAQISLLCASNCEKFDDDVMRVCALACRSCAATCQASDFSH